MRRAALTLGLLLTSSSVAACSPTGEDDTAGPAESGPSHGGGNNGEPPSGRAGNGWPDTAGDAGERDGGGNAGTSSDEREPPEEAPAAEDYREEESDEGWPHQDQHSEAFLHGVAPLPGLSASARKLWYEGLFETRAGELAFPTVQDAVYSSCTTAVLSGLSEQLIDEIACLSPGTMDRIDDEPRLTLGSATNARMQRAAAKSLKAAANQVSDIYLTSALRTLPQQYLLYRWYLAGRCGISLAASPGTSLHESGLAIDTSDYGNVRGVLEAQGYRWLGWSDPVHFDYVGGNVVDMAGLSVQAFQRLWNRNNPSDTVAEDGVYGSQTASKLSSAPADGFLLGAECDGSEPAPDPVAEPPATDATWRPGLHWERLADGSYKFVADAPASVDSLVYSVDGWEIGTGAPPSYEIRYRFESEVAARKVEARALAGSEVVATSVGMLDVSASTAFHAMPQRDGSYTLSAAHGPSGYASTSLAVEGDDVAYAGERQVDWTFVHSGLTRVVLRLLRSDGTLLSQLERSLVVDSGFSEGENAVPDELEFLSPASAVVTNPVSLRVTATPDVRVVRYETKDGKELGSSSIAATGFPLVFEFRTLGQHTVVAIGERLSGAELVRSSKTFEVQEVSGPTALELVASNPSNDASTWLLKVNASSDIARVDYVVDNQWPVGSSVAGPEFPLEYSFYESGSRSITAIGYSGAGIELVRATKVIDVGLATPASPPDDSGELGGYGMWLWYIEGTGHTHSELARRLAGLGVKRVYIKVADGAASCESWPELCDTSVPAAYVAEGVEPWAWAYNYPGNEYSQADALYYSAKAGYRGFVSDIEIEFDGLSTGLESLMSEMVQARKDAISDQHISELSAFPFHVTTWGNPIDHNMRVDIIDRYVDAHMPQTYLEVWGSTTMANAEYYTCLGTSEYRKLGAQKPVHHIVSMEHNTISPATVNEVFRAAGAGASVWRVPGTETPLSIWDDLEELEWSKSPAGSCE